MQHKPRDLPILAAAVLCIIGLAQVQGLQGFITQAPSDTAGTGPDPAQVQGLDGFGILLTLAMEVPLAIAVILLVYWYTQYSDYAVRSRLGEIRLEAGRTKRPKQARKARATDAMRAGIERLIHYSSLLAEMGGRYARVPEPKRPQFREDLEALYRNAAVHASELERTLESVGCLDGRTRDDVLTAIDLLRGASPIDYSTGMVDTAHYRAISRSLGPALTRLMRSLELATGRPPRRAGRAGEPGGLALRLDRHTYPPGAPIRATVEADGQFPHHEVTVAILDEGLATLAETTEEAPVRELERNACVAVDVIPKRRLVAGRDYIARATSGDLYDEAVLAVENISPTVRADRTTCAIGDIIAVTVEDPAAGVGGGEKGPSGTARGQRLVVESPCDRSDACRLRAAGASTGTFLGRVRCVGACGAATSGRRAWAWGAGAEDVDIACSPDQLIRIRYESGAGEARTAVLVEGTSTPSTTDLSEPDPAFAKDPGGGDGPGWSAGGCDGEGNGDRRHDTETKRHCRKGNRAGRMLSGSKEARGLGQ